MRLILLPGHPLHRPPPPEEEEYPKDLIFVT